ncbi:GAF domain-containing sensor histidine kinase [Nafulsella turpanensis]|uniref:GAF domain-containing sensor histidine kinase n=1 Tax=Nafulsella turpanensis TaxID=1265690 RepID=UPI0003479EA8|nr:GAF domain-containing sensor histidine kinase [Nafulsella turpanensis]
MSIYRKPASIIPQNDPERLKKLYRLEILDTPAETTFDSLAQLAAEIFDTPGAFITFVDHDRVFFKSNLSTLEGNEIKRQDSLCSLAILEDQSTVFEDTHQVPDLLESPYVACDGGMRFYAGAPLKTSDGYQLGTICVTDSVPRTATDKQMKMLERLSTVVVDELEQRMMARRAIRIQTDLMNMAVHDLKGPAANIALLSDLVLKNAAGNEKVKELVDKMKVCTGDINERLEGLLHLSLIENGNFKLQKEEVDLAAIAKAAIRNFELLARQKSQTIELKAEAPVMVEVDPGRMQEIIENLLSNAIKYAYPSTPIRIILNTTEKAAIVEVRDLGQGLSKGDMKKLFTKFAKLSAVPTGKERSSGLGLSIVKTLSELHNGKVWAESEGKDKGSSFFVSLPL